MSREDRYWQQRCARLERKLADKDDENAALKRRLRSIEERIYTPATLAILDGERRTG